MSSIRRVLDFLEETIAGVFLIGGLMLLFFGVVMRYIFQAPIFWLDEIAIYMVVWGAFLGFSVALRAKRHIQVVAVYDILPLKDRRLLDIFVSGVGIAFCIFFTYGGVFLVKTYLTTGQSSLNSQKPLWIVSLVIPVAGILFGLRFVEQLVGLFKNKGEEKTEEGRQADGPINR